MVVLREKYGPEYVEKTLIQLAKHKDSEGRVTNVSGMPYEMLDELLDLGIAKWVRKYMVEDHGVTIRNRLFNSPGE